MYKNDVLQIVREMSSFASPIIEVLKNVELLSLAELNKLEKVLGSTKKGFNTSDRYSRMRDALTNVQINISTLYPELAVLKYSKDVMVEDLWNPWYLDCRGVVLNITTNEIVSWGYPKFFNVGEPRGYSMSSFLLLQEVETVEKMDGSCLCVTCYNDDILVHTLGMIESEQAEWGRKELKKDKYCKFLSNMLPRTTYIFEEIYTENRVVVDYRGYEGLVLTGIRNHTGEVLPPLEVERFAVEVGLDKPKREVLPVTELLQRLKELKGVDGEGYVVWVEGQMHKIKSEDYTQIHSVIGYAENPRILLKNKDKIDDILAILPLEYQQNVLTCLQEVLVCRRYVEDEVKRVVNTVPVDLILVDGEKQMLQKLDDLLESIKYPKIGKTEEQFLRIALRKKVEKGVYNYVGRYAKEIDNAWQNYGLEKYHTEVSRIEQKKFEGFEYSNKFKGISREAVTLRLQGFEVVKLVVEIESQLDDLAVLEYKERKGR